MKIKINKAALLGLLILLPVASYAWPVTDMQTMLQHLQTNLPAVLRLIVATSYVMGLGLMIRGFFQLKAYGQQTVFMSGQKSIVGPITAIIVGAILFYFPTIIDDSIYTLWGYGAHSVIQYSTDADGIDLSKVVNPTISIIRIIGYIAFMRGWLMISKLGHQGGAPPGTISKAITHIIGGMLAINIIGTWSILKGTLGLIG